MTRRNRIGRMALLFIAVLVLVGASVACTQPETSTEEPEAPTEPEEEPADDEPEDAPAEEPTDTPAEEPTDEPADTSDEPIGKVLPERDTVEYGSQDSELTILVAPESADLFAGNLVRVKLGGLAMLEFGTDLRLTLFNDSELGLISKAAEGTSFELRAFLEEGSFIGELESVDGKAIFETPGGAEITVLGTAFFLFYEPDSEATLTGNFEGSMAVSGNGTSQSVPSGTFVEWSPGQPPGPQMPIPYDMRTFESLMKKLSAEDASTARKAEWLRLEPYCGNGLLNPGEACDGGGCGQGFYCTDACECVAVPVCGDGICEGDESYATCAADCPGPEGSCPAGPGACCGDGICQTDEGPDWCGDCVIIEVTEEVEAFCGNGIIEGGEECDEVGCEEPFFCTENCECVTYELY